MPGEFDDLVASGTLSAPAAGPGGGGFDDLIPSVQTPVPGGNPFGDLVPLTSPEAARIVQGLSFEGDPSQGQLSNLQAQFGQDDPPAIRVLGRVVLDPARYPEGLAAAESNGWLTPEQSQAMAADRPAIEKLASDRQRLLSAAGDNAELKARLYGFGRGATGAGVGIATGAGLSAALPALGLTNPLVAGAVVLAGSTLAGVGASEGYDALAAEMAKHNADVDGFRAAAQLEPGWAQSGELSALLLPAPGSIARLARGAGIAATERGAAGALRFIGGEVAKGAAIGAGADAIVRGAATALGAQGFEFSPESLGTAAGLGALLSGYNLRFRDYDTPQVAEIVRRGIEWERAKTQVGDGGIIAPAAGQPLNPAEQKVFDAAIAQLGALREGGARIIPEGVEINAEQVIAGGTAATRAETRAAVQPELLPNFGDLIPPTSAAGTPAPGRGAPSSTSAEPSPASAGPMVPVVPGAETVVFGSKGMEVPARYAWVPTAQVQASHSGEMMARNPEYRLENTRDYSEPAERDKQLDVLQNFDPRRHVTDAPDAAVGPSIIGTVIDEEGNASLQRFGGNSRGYAIANLPPEKRQALRELENAKAGQFGLEPANDPDAELVRHVGTFDLRQPGERDRAQALVDALNPSPGRVQGTAQRAAIDAEAVPPELLTSVGMDVSPGDARQFVERLIAQGHADRNLTSAIAAAPAQAQDYTQRLLVNAAFRQPLLAEIRSDPRAAGTTVRGLIDAAVPALVQMRALGGSGIAEAITRAYVNTLGYLDAGGTSLDHALEQAAGQMEFDPESGVAREIASALRQAVVTDARGAALPEPTAANAAALFETIRGAVAKYEPGADLFGESETLPEVVRRAVRHWMERGTQAPAADGGSGRRPVATAESSQPSAGSPQIDADLRRSAEPEEPQRLAEDDSGLRVNAAGGGDPYAPVKLAGLPGIRIVEMPEMMQLAQELGADVGLKRLRGSTRGFMMPLGGGIIRLDPRIFANQISAAKTMMHEIGHLIDWLPDRNLKRGNLWGRLWSLRKYMLEKFGSTVSTTTNKQLREELIALTQHWKPYDPATVSESYRKYRESAVELYADFISVLYNSPATAKQIAPKFFREFFRGIDSKPVVKQALVELQAWLHRPVTERLRERAVRVDQMFAKAQEIFERKWLERQERYQGFRGWMSRFKQAVFDHFAPIRDRADASGDKDAAAVIHQLFDSHPLASNEHWRWLERLQRVVVSEGEAAGFTMDDIGRQLFHERIARESYEISARLAATMGVDSGGRTVIANPQGHTPKTARDAILYQRTSNGIRRQTLLDLAVERFHDEVFAVMKEAHAAGLFTDAQMAIIEANRENYATFTPLEYVDTFVPAGFFHQAGTLKEIQNPFVSTVLKVLQLQRAIQFQKLKTATVRFLSNHFAGEIEKAETRNLPDGRGKVPVPPKQRGMEQIMVRERGKPAWYNVPKEIAIMFERPDVPLLQSALALLDVPFREIFYPIFISFNPLFQLVRNPIRDLRRTYVNAPGGVGLAGIARQLPLVKQLGDNEALDAVRALVKRGESEPLIAEMLAHLAIAPGEATFVTAGTRIAPTTFDKILADHGLLPPDEQATAFRRMADKLGIGRLLDAIERAGRMNELLPKASVYKQLRLAGWQPKDAAYYVRNFIGTPNFTRRGTHIGMLNPVLPFINIWMKGWAADIELARRGFQRTAAPGPGKSAASWWMRWAATSGIWTVLKVAGAVGLLGTAIKRLLDGIGEYDKTNYDVVPIGFTGSSEYNPQGKVAYLKVPKDPTDRVMSGVMFNTLRGLAVNAAKAGALGRDLQQLNAGADDRTAAAMARNVSVAAADVPGVNPMIKIGGAWTEFLKGWNPIDDFRGAHILSDAEHLAGGWHGLPPMLAWTWNQSGLQSFVRYDPDADTSLEQTVAMTPLVNGLVRISDYGYREQQMTSERLEDAAAAAARLSLPANARQLNSEYSFLRNIGADDRTPDQEVRFQELRGWHQGIYKPAEQMLRDAKEMQLSEETQKLIRERTAVESKGFEKR